jgi:arylsulfatase
VAATVLEAAELPEPLIVNSVQQMPLHGASMIYSFEDAAAPERHTTQYFEIFVNRGIYHQGWTAVTRHSIPWLVAPMPALDDDVWELYGPDDWTQAHNLAAEYPDKLRELQRLFLIEAVKYNVLPLDDRRVERFDAEMAGRPTLVKGTSQLLYGGTKRLSESATLNVKNRSHAITAEISVGDTPAEGVIVTQGGAFGGWALYARDGKPRYCYNFAGLQRFYVAGERAVPPGKHQVRVEFAYDGGGLGKGGSVTLYLDGAPIGAGRVAATMPLIYSGDETTDVGVDLGSPVAEDYGVRGNQFRGTVHWVQIERGLDDADHLISPEERWRVALAIQ